MDYNKLSKLKANLSMCLPESCFYSFHGMNPYPPIGQSQYIVSEIVTGDISHQLADLSLNIQQPCAFNEYYNISKHCFKEMMDVYASNVSTTFDKISKIEQSTRGQSASNKWFELRKYKITASNVYSAIINPVEPSAKLKSMYYTSFSSESTHHGIVNEGHVKNKYVERLK